MRRARCHGVLLCNRLLARCSSSVRPRLPARAPALGRTFSVSSARNESLDEEMVRLAKYRQTSVSLKATLDTGLGLLLPQKECALGLTSRQRTLIQIASFLKRELPVRLARRVLELKSGPEGIGSMPAVIRVREWYEQSFEDIRRARVPVDLETEAEFHRLLMKIYDRHAPTLVTMARGVHELRQALTQKNLVRSTSAGGEGEGVDFGELTELHTFLDKFYMSRIGIRILIGQYLELKKEEQEPGYVGLIYQHTNPAEITQQARSRGPARPWLPRTERTRARAEALATGHGPLATGSWPEPCALSPAPALCRRWRTPSTCASVRTATRLRWCCTAARTWSSRTSPRTCTTACSS